jgi:mannose-6-phosphate isomerase-like protein (cupin superfamily)
MVKKSSELKGEPKENVRGGSGVLEFSNYFTQEELQNKARLCTKITINPGCSIGLHEHVNEEEIFFIISGSGTLNDNGTICEIKAGDASLTRNKEFHSIENTGKEPIEMLAVVILY